MTDASIDTTEQIFQIHFIAITRPSRSQKVRMLWVSTTGVPAVYEGPGTWSGCVHCVSHLPNSDISENEWIQARELFEKYEYTTLRGVIASLSDLESLGLQRADR
jgi:hypothetical protein